MPAWAWVLVGVGSTVGLVAALLWIVSAATAAVEDLDYDL